jgi:histone-lysine N-methyltransferase SETMAR
MVEEIEDLVLSDRQMKLVFIARVIGVPETTVWKVLHDDLGIKKMSACWIPRLHTSEQKKFDSFTSFFSRIVTRAETWVYHLNPLTKQESMHGFTKVRFLPTQSSVRTIMETIFWDEEGIMLIEYLVKGTTINGEVHLKTIQSLKKALMLKQPSSCPKKNLLLHYNCKAVIQECGFTKLRHPSYGLCDYFLFKNVEKTFGAENLQPIMG